jgi:hypothetical protein
MPALFMPLFAPPPFRSLGGGKPDRNKPKSGTHARTLYAFQLMTLQQGLNIQTILKYELIYA